MNSKLAQFLVVVQSQSVQSIREAASVVGQSRPYNLPQRGDIDELIRNTKPGVHLRPRSATILRANSGERMTVDGPKARAVAMVQAPPPR
jgi:hypothetical protein